MLRYLMLAAAAVALAGCVSTKNVPLETVNWSFVYFPTDWNNYRVIYSTKLRLIDTKRSKLLAEGFCARVPDQTAESPSHEELLAEGAARLKKELAVSADHCVEELRRTVLAKT